ncbi:CPS_collapsed_G0046290.mRNA.1.CDS.1 [Saccharomyces cerevisiae]|nr:CPS_collapsed_G0046290.mRNA.1.CDS.1 [Saccharomyces cerevisiae]
MLNSNEKLRKLTAPYLSARIALALRRYISDEYLIGRAPIPKLRKNRTSYSIKWAMRDFKRCSRSKFDPWQQTNWS